MPALVLTIRRYAALFACIMALIVSSAALAQTTGSLKGIVEDPDGLGLPGVSVEIASEKLIGGAQSRTTDNNGNYQFAQLPPGPYDVTFRRDNFKTVTQTGVIVKISGTAFVRHEMEYSEAVEEIEVIGAKQQVVDVEDVSRGEVLTKEFLQRIPAGRSYQSAVQMAAGVTGGANPNMAGAASNENTYMLDGANITDPVTGTFSLNFNYDAIQQIEVLLGGFMPEYGTSLGGIINLVTESGTNNLEFDTSVYYQNGNWRGKKDARYTADGFPLAPTDFDSQFQLLRMASMISGPVVRDRAWFIISYQHTRSVIASTGIDTPRDFDGHYVLAKLTVQPNSEHRLTAFMQLNPTSIDNTSQRDIFKKAEAQGRQWQGGFVGQARWQWFLSPEANLDTMLVVQKSSLENAAVPCTHNRKLGYHPCRPGEEEGEVDWDTPPRLGLNGAYDSVNYGRFYFDDRWRFQASTKLSLLSLTDPLGGTHDVKAGLEGVQTIWDQIQGFGGNNQYYDINEVGYDPQTFTNYYWYEITGPIKFTTSGSQWNFFIQDAWKPISNLVIKGGVRYDNTVMRNDQGIATVSAGLWGPRLYASWDPFGDQKTKIAGGYGRFNDTARLAIASFTSKSAIGAKLYLGELFDDGTGQGFVNSANSMANYQPREKQNFAHDTLRTPRSDEFNLIVQREIVDDVGIKTDVSYKMTRHIYEFDEISRVYDEDGSAVIGARYGNPDVAYNRMRTPVEARRNYFVWDAALYKVFSRRWFASVTYSFQRSFGTSTSALSGSFANGPQTQYNYGRLVGTDIAHSVKGYFSWDLPTDPWKQSIGGSLVYESGLPLERYYFGDEPNPGGAYNLRIRPRGVYTRFPGWWELGLKFTQDFDVRKGTLKIDFEFANVFNNRAPQNFYATFYTENRLFTSVRQSPFRLQLGLRYQF